MSAGSITKLVETLVAAGCTPDMILAAVRTAEASKDAEIEGSKEGARARWRKWKASQTNVGKRLQPLANDSQQLTSASPAPDLENKQTNKQGKKENKSPRDELASVLDAEHADAVLDHRNRLRKPLSSHAAHLLAASLASCPDPNAAADQMIESGWLKIKPGWLESRGRQNGHSPPERSVSDVLGEMAAGTWTGPKDTTPNEPFIETSFTRRN